MRVWLHGTVSAVENEIGGCHCGYCDNIATLVGVAIVSGVASGLPFCAIWVFRIASLILSIYFGCLTSLMCYKPDGTL